MGSSTKESSRVASIAAELQTIGLRILATESPEYDPWLYKYWSNVRDPGEMRAYVRYQLDNLRLANVDPEGKAVLDAGSGFGLTLIALGLLGAAELRGVELHEGMVRTVDAYAHLLPEPLQERFHTVAGDVSDLPFDDDRFDLLLSYEAISHYLHVDRFIGEAHRVLKPGGTMIIADGNNGANPRVRRKTHEIWRAFEVGAPREIHGHTVDLSYTDMREAAILECFPEIDRPRELALRTSGMTRSEVIAATERYLADGTMPESRFDPARVPVHPDGQVIERLFDPHELGRQIEAAGFETKVFGYWGGAAGKPALRLANRILQQASRLTVYTAPAFRIVARKR